jgi:hypothetical protein
VKLLGEILSICDTVGRLGKNHCFMFAFAPLPYDTSLDGELD